MNKTKKNIIFPFLAVLLIFSSLSLLGIGNASATPIAEDSYDTPPNNSFGDAHYLPGSGLYEYLCLANEDWYNISVEANEIIKINIEFDGSINNVDLELYDENNYCIEGSYGTWNNETITWASYMTQVVYIRVYGCSGSYYSEPYNMSIDMLEMGSFDDDFEPNNNFSSAAELVPDYYHDLVNNDTDYYKIYLDQDVSIDIFNTTDLTVQWFNSSWDWLADFSNLGHLYLDWNLTYIGDYYFVVSGPDLGHLYDIDIWLTGFMWDDIAEPNNDFNEAYELWSGDYYQFLNQSDFDYYKIWLNQHDTVSIIVEDTHSLYVDFYDHTHNGVGMINYESGYTWINYKACSPDYHYLVISSGSNMGYLYNISINIEHDDWAEPNDFLSEAQYLNMPCTENLIQLDDDWFYFNVNSGEHLSVELFYDTYSSPWFAMELWDNTYTTQLATGYYVDDHYQLDWYNPSAAQNVYLFVYGNDNGDWYDLNVFADDWAESNDDFYDSCPLGFGYYSGLYQFDDDWFDFWVNPDESIIIELFCDTYSSPWFEMELWDSTYATQLATGYYIDDHYHIDWYNPYESQNVYLLVNGSDIGDWYSLDVFYSGNDDWAEENDFLTESHPLGIEYYSDLYQFDDDWFNFGGINDKETARVEIYYDTAYYLDLELVDQNGNPHGYYMQQESWGKWLEWTAAGYYSNAYIRVWGNNIGESYNISLNIWDNTYDDWAEENDYKEQPTWLDPNYHSGLSQFDDDWFAITVFPDETLRVEMIYDTYMSSSLELAFYDETYLSSANQWDESGKKITEWYNDRGHNQDIFILVSGDDIGEWYDLDIFKSNENGTTDDWMEENDRNNNAWQIDEGKHNQLKNFDDDYYQFHLKEGEMAVIYVYCEDNLPLWLETEDGYLDNSTEDGFLELEITADHDCDVIFAVKGDNSGLCYDLELKIEHKNDPGDPGNGNDPFDFDNIPGFPIEVVGSIFAASAIAMVIFIKKKIKV